MATGVRAAVLAAVEPTDVALAGAVVPAGAPPEVDVGAHAASRPPRPPTAPSIAAACAPRRSSCRRETPRWSVPGCTDTMVVIVDGEWKRVNVQILSQVDERMARTE